MDSGRDQFYNTVATAQEVRAFTMRDPEDNFGPLVTSTDKTGRSPDPTIALVPAN